MPHRGRSAWRGDQRCQQQRPAEGLPLLAGGHLREQPRVLLQRVRWHGFLLHGLWRRLPSGVQGRYRVPVPATILTTAAVALATAAVALPTAAAEHAATAALATAGATAQPAAAVAVAAAAAEPAAVAAVAAVAAQPTAAGALAAADATALAAGLIAFHQSALHLLVRVCVAEAESMATDLSRSPLYVRGGRLHAFEKLFVAHSIHRQEDMA